jgi:hypothetical protein
MSAAIPFELASSSSPLNSHQPPSYLVFDALYVALFLSWLSFAASVCLFSASCELFCENRGVVYPRPTVALFRGTSVLSSFACPPLAGLGSLWVSCASFALSLPLYSTSSVYIAKKRTHSMPSPRPQSFLTPVDSEADMSYSRPRESHPGLSPVHPGRPRNRQPGPRPAGQDREGHAFPRAETKHQAPAALRTGGTNLRPASRVRREAEHPRLHHPAIRLRRKRSPDLSGRDRAAHQCDRWRICQKRPERLGSALLQRKNVHHCDFLGQAHILSGFSCSPR